MIEEVINGQNYALLPDLLHADYMYRAPGEELVGPGSLQVLFSGYREAFPDLHVRIDNLFGDGEQVATTLTLTGTHAGPLMGLPATGRSVSVDGIVHSRVRDGRIAEEWELLDMASLMQQLTADGAD
ncbi:MAG: ester cyclase [Bacteroidota bacterium]